MKKTRCWAIKNNMGKFVNRSLDEKFWEADRTLLFRTRKYAQAWLNSNPYWNGRATIVKAIVTVREFGE